MLGRLTVNTSSSHSSLLSSIESSVKGDINDMIADVAKKLNIHDFYSAHLLDYCEVSQALVVLLGLDDGKELTECKLGLLHPGSSSKPHRASKQECHQMLQPDGDFSL